MKNIFLFIVIHLMSFHFVYAQDFPLYGISTQWDNSFKEWYIYTEDEEEEGELFIRWKFTNDWSEWDYELNDESGAIKTKFPRDLSQWELRGNNQIVTMKTRWMNDFTEWKIGDGTVDLILESRFTNQLEEWEVDDKTYGSLKIYTVYEGDLRDWAIEDNLSEEVSFEIKMAILFTVIYQSTPKF